MTVSGGACEGCGAFRAKCLQPGGDGDEGAVELCWFCAHLVADHEMPMAEVKGIPHCGCSRDEIYPVEFRKGLDAEIARLDAEYEAKRPVYWRGVVRQGGKPYDPT